MKAGALHRLVPRGWARGMHRLRRLLGRRVRFRRAGLDVRILLEPIASPAREGSKAARADTPPPRSATEVGLMLDDLTELLDSHPMARSVFPPLVLVERGLERRGAPALERFPSALRQTAIDLLDRLDGVGARPGLTLLREHLHALEPAFKPRPTGPAVQVEEASLTVFMEADRAWEQQWEQATGTPPAATDRDVRPATGAGR